MSGQGCPHEGTDHRLFGRWGRWVQTALSFHTTIPPIRVLLQFPPFVALVVQTRRDPPRFFTFRAGFRWDPHWPYAYGTGRTGGYIFPEVIIKAAMGHAPL